MIFSNKKLIIAAVFSWLPALAIAGGAGPTLGLQIGSNQINLDNVNNEKTMGVSLGYDFGNAFAVEFQANDGDWGIGRDNGRIKTQALYGVFRSEGEAYFLVKLGVVKEEVSLEDATEDDTGASYGVGGGKNFNDHFALEADYTVIDENISVIAVGGRIKF